MNALAMDIFSILEVLGTIAFAISGAMVAIEKKVDIFGVLLLGLTTAVGGGILRDVLLGYVPPRIFQSRYILLLALISSLIVFLVAYFAGAEYHNKEDFVDKINNVFDAMGLGAFTVTGMRVAMNTGTEDVVFIIFLGVLTGIGGGLIRDLMVDEIPFVLKKYVYAVASICGGLCYWYLLKFGFADNIAMVFSIVLVFGIRIMATIFRWNLPKVRE